MEKALIFQVFGISDIDGTMAAVKVNDDSYGHGCFRGSNRYNEYSEKQSIHFIMPEVFIKCHEIQVHAIQYQLNAHKHRDQVSSYKKTITADEKKRCADE
jgi:hypothetical protein